ncbi:hypothetical protein GOY17_01865 [Lysobacter soli]|uniref:hypothetical protein n=1 Tax=Lysobacter soli TaxID=453783 RepID=UPI0012EDF66E|nr:hypothetical protein [Lysobacter soli]QGW63771.1 hypothetical protein GOY17_01865 [Lysobacter soli]
MRSTRVNDDLHEDARSVKLLWTGGWDSTFRLLQLLLRDRARVIPYYLEDRTRPSTDTEIDTMARIAQRLNEEFPHTRELLQPLRRAAVADIVVDDDIAIALSKIRRRSFIGSQYAWLPAFCRDHTLDGMELGVHVDDKVQALLRGFVVEVEHPAGFRSVRVDPARIGTPEHTLFGAFGFPLFRVDKRGIERESRAAGWDGIMEMTWFCHRPVRGKPCGLCAPCVYTIEEGLARRVPWPRRVLSFFYRRFVLPWKGPLRQLRLVTRGTRERPPPEPDLGA